MKCFHIDLLTYLVSVSNAITIGGQTVAAPSSRSFVYFIDVQRPQHATIVQVHVHQVGHTKVTGTICRVGSHGVPADGRGWVTLTRLVLMYVTAKQMTPPCLITIRQVTTLRVTSHQTRVRTAHNCHRRKRQPQRYRHNRCYYTVISSIVSIFIIYNIIREIKM